LQDLEKTGEYITPIFGGKLGTAISDLIPLSVGDFANAPIPGKRREKRISMIIKKGVSPRFIDLHYS
jgi:hypothetical protein